MRLKIFFIGTFYLCLLSLLHSQILRVDKTHLSQDSATYWTGAFDIHFIVNNSSSTNEVQNTFVSFQNNADVAYIGSENAYLVIGQLQYLKTSSTPFLYNGSVHLRSILKRKHKLAYELFTQTQFEESRSLASRRLLGGGVRWNILRRKNSLFAGLGTFRELEEWNTSTETVYKNLWKMNSYLGGELHFTGRLLVNFIGYYQTGYDGEIEGFRNRVSLWFEIKERVTKNLRVKLAGDLRYEQNPLIDINRLFYGLNLGFEVQFN